MGILTQFATSEPAKADIFTTLGIDWKTLILQIIAFVILVWLLGKFVYPWLMKSVDERQAQIEESVKAVQAAEEKAESAQEEVAKLLKEARKEASEIIGTAKDEANAAIEASEKKAKSRADKIVADAHDQIEKDVIAARKTLHNDTIELVALATEKVIGKAVSDKVDDKVIANAVKEAN